MSRHRGFFQAMAKAQRDAEMQKVAQLHAQQRLQSQLAKQAAQAQRAYLAAQKADQKERARLYTESRIAEVALQNEQLESEVAQLEHLLLESLPIDNFVNWETLKQPLNMPPFEPGPLAIAEQPPDIQHYLPPELTGLQKFMPGPKERHAQEVAKAHERYRADMDTHTSKEMARQQRLAEAKVAYDRQSSLLRANLLSY